MNIHTCIYKSMLKLLLRVKYVLQCTVSRRTNLLNSYPKCLPVIRRRSCYCTACLEVIQKTVHHSIACVPLEHSQYKPLQLVISHMVQPAPVTVAIKLPFTGCDWAVM